MLAKTQATGAKVISDCARLNVDTLSPMRLVGQTTRTLEELVARRRQLVGQTVANKDQREHVTLKSLRASVDRTIKHRCVEVKLVQAGIQELIDADAALKARQDKLLTVKGIDPRVSRVLVSELPELGVTARRR